MSDPIGAATACNSCIGLHCPALLDSPNDAPDLPRLPGIADATAYTDGFPTADPEE